MDGKTSFSYTELNYTQYRSSAYRSHKKSFEKKVFSINIIFLCSYTSFKMPLSAVSVIVDLLIASLKTFIYAHWCIYNHQCNLSYVLCQAAIWDCLMWEITCFLIECFIDWFSSSSIIHFYYMPHIYVLLPCLVSFKVLMFETWIRLMTEGSS